MQALSSPSQAHMLSRIPLPVIGGAGYGQTEADFSPDGRHLYLCTTHEVRDLAWFAAAYPGKIMPLDLLDFQGKLICQKDSFLCAAKGVSIGIAFHPQHAGSVEELTPSAHDGLSAVPLLTTLALMLVSQSSATKLARGFGEHLLDVGSIREIEKMS